MHSRFCLFLFTLCVWLGFTSLAGAQTYYCNQTSACSNSACCGYSDNQGICGYGPTYCGDTCISNCDATAECGEYASDPSASCPLNVCCSSYGFCGTTSDFCGHGCQGDNCGDVTVPSCSSNDVFKTKIGYYESWASGRSCDGWRPNDIPVSSLTHVNYAFATFEPTNSDNTTWTLDFMTHGVDNVHDLVKEFIGLKDTNPALSCYLSVGGWSFEDPPRQLYWSEMAATSDGRKSFAKAVLYMLQQFGFDGVDLDWEYPVASDRGGRDEDKENYVKMVEELRSVLDDSGETYGITFTAPSSYWYLQHFDLPGLLKAGADWTNLMSYDLHGVWDKDDAWIGSVMQAHTNMTEIKEALDLFWRVGVDPSKVVLGTAFYGRSFTISDLDCISPGCSFSGAGTAGSCTDSAGTLSYKEIMESIADYDGVSIYDNTSAVEYAIFNEDQWVSYDTNVTFKQKIDYANDICLGGIMIWSVDQDTYEWDAMTALLNKDVSSDSLLSDDSDAKDLANMYSAYTGTSCYITECVDWNTGQCKDGYSVLDYVHRGSKGMIEDPDDKVCKTGKEGDDDAEYRLICCPTDAMPQGCAWEGMSDDGFCTGGGTCSDNTFELVADSYTDRTGNEFCVIGKRSLCCNENSKLTKCHWTPCNPSESDLDGWTSNTVSFYGGSNLHQDSERCSGPGDLGESYWTCPSEDTYKNCEWKKCVSSCPSDKVLITQRTEVGANSTYETSDCSSYPTGVVNMMCCDPPGGASDAPVDPKKLFKYPDEDNDSYYYNVQESSNDEDDDNESTNPFAFIMIDGDVDSYSESLVDQWTFLTDEDTLSKRNLRFHKRNNIFEYREDTFDNTVETYHIMCTQLYTTSSGCDELFHGGAINTIVKMPKDIGAGPYARVVSLVPWGSSSQNLKPRDADEMYELAVDYDLPAASSEKKGDVNFRVDYTNLQEYWNEITDAPASSGRKRWFGSFDSWLAKMTTMVKDEQGSLPLEFDRTLKLYHAHQYCPKLNVDATFDIDAFIHLGLYAQYGYYFEGSILPSPSLIASYGYFSIDPVAEILLTLRAEAVMQSNSDKVELFTAGFPGLSIKGLISIGPELALSGELDASLKVSGELNAGVAIGWERTEVYFPQDEAAKDAGAAPKDLTSDDDQTYSFDPIFNAQLTAKGNMALTLTPEVRFGISVLGGDLMSGQVTAGVANTVSLGINASTSVSQDGSASAGFCYWADFVYKIFLRADMSFIGDLAYWGAQLDVASPTDPLVLVEETCVQYSTNKTFGKRSDPSSLVKNTTEEACFGGLISCSTVNDDTCAISENSTDSTVSKRATNCDFPALWYNCDFFPDKSIKNLNQNTQGTNPYAHFIGICHNIRNYMQTHLGSDVGSNWMNLEYIDQDTAKFRKHREQACGTGSDGKLTQTCAEEKRSLWPVSVINSYNTGQTYQTIKGFSESVSCDEFPFNGALQGGAGAQTACTPVEQQEYQKFINKILGTIWDISANKQWLESDRQTAWTGSPRYYTMNLMYGSTDGNTIGTKGGKYSTTNTLAIAFVMGGVNLRENSNLEFRASKGKKTNNAVCQIGYPRLNTWLGIDLITLQYCHVTYVSSTNPVKRDDGTDSPDWEIDEIEIPENWEETATTVPADDPEAIAKSFFEILARDDKTETYNASRKAHVDRHRRGASHGHGHGH